MFSDPMREMLHNFVRNAVPVHRARKAVEHAVKDFNENYHRGEDSYLGGFADGSNFGVGLAYAALGAEQEHGGKLDQLDAATSMVIAAALLVASDAQDAEVERINNGVSLSHVSEITAGHMGAFAATIAKLMKDAGITEVETSIDEANEVTGQALHLVSTPGGFRVEMVDAAKMDEHRRKAN